MVRSPAEASRALEAATARLSAARGWRRWLLPPLVAWLVANAVFAVTAVYGGDNPFDAHTWTSWDSPIYLGIAQDGYTSYECPQAELDQGAWACGNFGWFPLYPALIAPFLHAGLDGEAVGVAISSLFWLGLLIVVWRGLLLPAAGRATLPALALATFAPGAFYFHTVYPVSMAACLLAIALVCLRDHRWWGAGGAAALATATYPTAGVVAGVAGLWLLLVAPAPDLRERIRRILVVCVPPVVAVALVFGYAELATGQWNGYFGVQARFRDGFTLPFGNWLDITKPRFEGLGHVSIFLSLQSLLTTLLVATVLVATWRRRRDASPFDWLVALWALAFWLVPLCQDVVAYYRTDTLLVPIAVAFARLAPLYVTALAGAGAVIAAGMTLAFMQGILV